ncbi:MAG: hypothetical protein ACQESR_11510 [Planctomycetota bacterium]
MTDIFLDAWIGFTAEELIKRGKMTVDFYRDKFRDIMEAPRLLGGVLLFDDTSLVGSRVNYNANDGCKITQALGALPKLAVDSGSTDEKSTFYSP